MIGLNDPVITRAASLSYARMYGCLAMGVDRDESHPNGHVQILRHYRHRQVLGVRCQLTAI